MAKLSVYLSYLLRHHPEDIHLDMDKHGYVEVKQLIDHINHESKYHIDRKTLDYIVATDNKQRFKYNDKGTYIKACQGHSIAWVEPELTYKQPPDVLYHGTTMAAFQKIKESGHIDKMNRHAVHMQDDIDKAWQSARRWQHQTPTVLMIDSLKMAQDGYVFGVSDNDVWCIESVPFTYIKGNIVDKQGFFENKNFIKKA